MSISKLSEATRDALNAAITSVYHELGKPDYKALSTAVRAVVKTRSRQLDKENKQETGGDSRERTYNLAKLQIWDVTAGESKADLEGEAEPQPGLIGLRSVFAAVADLVASFHDGQPPAAVTLEGLEDKLPSLRSLLAANSGHTGYRIRYDHGEAAYLIYLEVAREGAEGPEEEVVADPVADDDVAEAGGEEPPF